jgi:protein phosphatase
MLISVNGSTAQTHTGLVREHNEDAVFADDQGGVYLVADGMGGHAHGEVASALAVDIIPQELAQGSSLSDAVSAAHRAISTAGIDEESQKSGMGTTAVCAQIRQGRLEVAWVGDSRAYFCAEPGRSEESLQQLTRDHSYLEFLIESGQLSPEQAINHPKRNIVTQSLGMGEPVVDTVKPELLASGVLLLCSDGLTDLVADGYIEALLSETASDARGDLKGKAQALIERALALGGKDNISVVLVKIQVEEDPSRPAACRVSVASEEKPALSVTQELDQVDLVDERPLLGSHRLRVWINKLKKGGT